jgi:hypothetical protein
MGITPDRLMLLQSLLQSGAAQNRPAPSSGMGPFGLGMLGNMQPTAAQAPDMARQQYQQSLIQQLSQPAPYEQAPVPKEVGVLEQMLGTLADVFGTKAAGLSGNNALNPHALDMLRQRREQRDAAIAANEAGGKRAQYDAKTRQAALELQRVQKEDDAAARASEIAGERTYQAGRDKARDDADLLRERERIKAENERAAAERGKDITIEELRNKGDLQRARITKSGDDEVLNRQMKMRQLNELGEGRKYIGRIVRGYTDEDGNKVPPLVQRLADGTITPDAADAEFYDLLDETELDDAGRKELEDNFKKRAGPILERARMFRNAQQDWIGFVGNGGRDRTTVATRRPADDR